MPGWPILQRCFFPHIFDLSRCPQRNLQLCISILDTVNICLTQARPTRKYEAGTRRGEDVDETRKLSGRCGVPLKSSMRWCPDPYSSA